MQLKQKHLQASKQDWITTGETTSDSSTTETTFKHQQGEKPRPDWKINLSNFGAMKWPQANNIEYDDDDDAYIQTIKYVPYICCYYCKVNR